MCLYKVPRNARPLSKKPMNNTLLYYSNFAFFLLLSTNNLMIDHQYQAVVLFRLCPPLVLLPSKLMNEILAFAMNSANEFNDSRWSSKQHTQHWGCIWGKAVSIKCIGKKVQWVFGTLFVHRSTWFGRFGSRYWLPTTHPALLLPLLGHSRQQSMRHLCQQVDLKTSQQLLWPI